MKQKIEVVVSWHEPSRSWIAVSSEPPARASASSARRAVKRLRASVGDRIKFNVDVVLPPKAVAAIDRYRKAAQELAERQQHVLDMQMELARELMESCALNRSQAAVMVGLSQSYLSRLLDGKVARDSASIAPIDPAAELAAFVADERTGSAPFKRNAKKR